MSVSPPNVTGQRYRSARRKNIGYSGRSDRFTLLIHPGGRAAPKTVAPADFKHAVRGLELDGNVHLTLADPAVLEIDRDFEHAEAEPLGEVGHFNLEIVAVGAHLVQRDLLQHAPLPAFEAGGGIAHLQVQHEVDPHRVGPPAQKEAAGAPALV